MYSVFSFCYLCQNLQAVPRHFREEDVLKVLITLLKEIIEQRYLHKQELMEDVGAWFCRNKWKAYNIIPLTKHLQPRVFNASELPKNIVS